MSKSLVIALFLFYPFILFSQSSWNGSYFNEATEEILIHENDFYFIIPQGVHPVYSTDTLAVCSIKRVEGHFVELNSLRPKVIAEKDMQIIQEYDAAFEETKVVFFDLPCQRKVEIEIWTDEYDYFRLDYSSSNRFVELPKHTKAFQYQIFLKEIPMPSSDGLLRSIILYNPLMGYKEIERGKNVVRISLPSVNDSFFERYCVSGEYARLCNDTIIWRNDVFILKQK